MGSNDIYFSVPREELEKALVEFGNDFYDQSISRFLDLRPLVLTSSFRKGLMYGFVEAATYINAEPETTSSRLAYIDFIGHICYYQHDSNNFYSDIPDINGAVYFSESVQREWVLIEQIDFIELAEAYAMAEAERVSSENRLQQCQRYAQIEIQRILNRDPESPALQLWSDKLSIDFKDNHSLRERSYQKIFKKLTEGWEDVTNVWRHARDHGHCIYWTIYG